MPPDAKIDGSFGEFSLLANIKQPYGRTAQMAVTSTITGATLSDSEHSRQLRRAVIASTIGTTIEWYDFFIYGTAAGLVFGKLYFTNEDPLTATLSAFGTYLSAPFSSLSCRPMPRSASGARSS
jgi:hypothetical protein